MLPRLEIKEGSFNKGQSSLFWEWRPVQQGFWNFPLGVAFLGVTPCAKGIFPLGTGSQKYPWKGCVGIKSSSFEWASLLSSKLLRIQLGTKLNYKMQLKLDPRNAIPVLELVPNLLVSEIFKRLTTSVMFRILATTLLLDRRVNRH